MVCVQALIFTVLPVLKLRDFFQNVFTLRQNSVIGCYFQRCDPYFRYERTWLLLSLDLSRS